MSAFVLRPFIKTTLFRNERVNQRADFSRGVFAPGGLGGRWVGGSGGEVQGGGGLPCF